MTMLYSPSTKGFYSSKIHKNTPKDSVEISNEEYESLMQAQFLGKEIIPGENGKPNAVDRGTSPEEIKLNLTNKVQFFIDSKAQSFGYSDIKTAVTYAEENSVPKFQIEGLAFRKWRSLVWEKCYLILSEVQSGQRDIPTAEELISELPLLEI